jgi:hypothetical protein
MVKVGASLETENGVNSKLGEVLFVLRQNL